MIGRSRPVLSFRGLTRDLYHHSWDNTGFEKWRSPQQLYAEVQQAKQKRGVAYVGRLPKQILQLSPENPRAIYEFMDKVALYVRSQGEEGQEAFKTPIGRKLLWANLGHDTNGHGLKFVVNGHEYCLKVYIEPEKIDIHGIYGELAAASFLAPKQFSDLAKFYFANPLQGWTVCEYIPFKSERILPPGKGPSFKNLPIRHYDTLKDDNAKQGRQVDYGAIRTALVDGKLLTLDHLKTILTSGNSDWIIEAAKKSDVFKDDEWLEAYRLIMDSGVFKAQLEATKEAYFRGKTFLKPVCEKLLECGNHQATAQMIGFIHRLDEKTFCEFFRQALAIDNDAIRCSLLSSALFSDSQNLQWWAFQQLLTVDNPTEILNDIRDILFPALPLEHQAEALQMLAERGIT